MTISKRQQEILFFIADYRNQHGIAPTLQEIASAAGVHRSTAYEHLCTLQQRRFIMRDEYKQRSIEIIGEAKQLVNRRLVYQVADELGAMESPTRDLVLACREKLLSAASETPTYRDLIGRWEVDRTGKKKSGRRV